MKWKRILIALLCLLVYLALIVWLGLSLGFTGSRLALFLILLGLLGVAATIATLWYLGRMDAQYEPGSSSSPDSVNLHSLIRDADNKFRHAARGDGKALAELPMLFVVGDENSAKTQTVIRCGLDPELLGGAVYQDQAVMPTQLVNLWLSGSWLIGEAGGALLRHPQLWIQFIKSTLPARFGSAFSSDSRLPPRLALVCVSVERLMAPNTTEQIRALAQKINERLRQLSQTLGISLPVYVLFTKLDTIASFPDFAARLTEEEVRLPVGSLLTGMGSDSSLYSQEATAAVSSHFDALAYALSEFRVDALARGGQLQELARAYEFPRDLRKLRAGIVSFLIEVARPSQIGFNPFLRGFYFSGMRAHFVQAVSEVAQSFAPRQDVPDTGATRAFSYAMGGSQPAQAQAPRGPLTRKEPQWVFLPTLMSSIVLSDKAAHEVSRVSGRTHFMRRLLLATVVCAAACLLLFSTISFFKNKSLVSQVTDAARVQLVPPPADAFATLADLQKLEALRTVVDTLEKYRRDGAPTLYRVGLYRGNDVLPYACQAYSERFRALLLNPAQRGILTRMSALPAAPAKEDSYADSYRPLKAYLITTSNPNPDTAQDITDFLPAALQTAWAGNNAPDAEAAQLALRQFAFYAAHLAAPDSCMANIGGSPNQNAVAKARIYLSGFEGFQHIYQSMLTAAGRGSPSFTFNSKFPGSALYIVDTYTIQGAFTHDGFLFMQNAILHPDAYVGGEQWVLGPSSAGPIDRAALAAQLNAAYNADFLLTWRSYLSKAQFVSYQSLPDAASKLSALDSDTSAVLELLSLVSDNTRVPSTPLAQAFQAPQSVVAQTAPGTRLIAASNQPYIQALQGIEAAIKGVLANPMSANDPAAYGPIGQSAVSADQAAKAVSIAFVPDPQGNVDKTTLAILEAPIQAAQELAAQGPAKAAGGAAKNFCAQIQPLMSKFPFDLQATQEATPEEVAQVFTPGQGAFAQFYNASIRSLVVQQGSQFVPAPGSAVRINPAFLAFLSSAQKISTSLFAAGGNTPTLDFALTEVRTPGAVDAALTIDGKELKGAGQTASFHWTSQPASVISLTTPQDARNFSRSWSVFRFAYAATEPAPNRLKFSFSLNNQAPEVVFFDASGPGAALLNPAFMKSFRCVSTVGR